MSTAAVSWWGLGMEGRDFPDAPRLEKFRNYLHILTRLQLGPKSSSKLDASDIVQETLLHAYQRRDQFRGSDDAARAKWLRAILARNVADALRSQGRHKRDIARETSLQEKLDSSSDSLGARLVAEQSTPSAQAMRHELAVHVADALAQIPHAQREALLLHYWQGCSLAEIAVQLDRTTDAVGGLLKRGLQHLRELLDTQD
jgi:RNA polymerase sigma-70 factor (ECF subfamily)